MNYVKKCLAVVCLMMLAACGSTDNSTQFASWDDMYYYGVDMPSN
jgi:uncharacterized lipoprotein YmbA